MTWAMGHHKSELAGKGYPDTITYNDLSIEQVLLKTADIISALGDDRPYRKGYKDYDKMIKVLFKGMYDIPRGVKKWEKLSLVRK